MQTGAGASGINVSDVVYNIMRERILFHNEEGNQETPLDAFYRVAKHVAMGHAVYEDSAEVERFIEKAAGMMYEHKFMPNTPTLVNSGFPKAQCSACFVLPIEDNLPSIYKAHHDQGLIQASGGGCVDGDTYIYTEEHGIIKIKDIPDFKRVKEHHKEYALKSGQYETISYNETMGIFQRDYITHVWKFNVKKKDVRTIKFNIGEIKTSSWHPFLVVEGSKKHNNEKIIEKTAGELKEGDKVLTIQPNHGLLKSWGDEFSWLLGYLVGDGSIGEWKGTHDRIRFYDQRLDILTRVQKIFKKYGVDRGFTKDNRENCFIFTTTSSKNCNNTNVNHELRSLFDRLQEYFNSNKFILNKFKDVPSIYSFIAGLVDSEGYIGKDYTAVSMSDGGLIYELQKWLALLGIRSTIRKRVPRESHWSDMFELKYANCWNRIFPTVKKSRLTKNKYSNTPEVVVRIDIGDKDEEFYDFTVKNNNNYIAFTGKAFVVIHNTGFFLGNIRSVGTKAANRFITRGPVNWLRMLNENATHVAQGMREGANMAILDIGHPDIVDFITCKKAGYDLIISDLAKQFGVSEEEAKRIKSIIGIEKFNISVSITDRFMRALEVEDDWYFIDSHTQEKKGQMPAKDIWDLIIRNAHKHGEPGLFFEDTANRGHSIPHIGKIQATNPCGEQILLPYESCTLGHVNLSKFVAGINGTSQVNWEALEDVIRFGIQFLDNIVEVNYFPIPNLADMNKNTRRIGLGIMGWADMLATMNIPYDSAEAIEKAEEVGKFFDHISLDESRKLGKDRGNFPYFEGSIFDGCEESMRNSDRTTIAPTGTTSLYAMCSSSIEPLFAPVTVRDQAGMVQVDYHPALFDILDRRGLDTPEIRQKLAKVGGSLRHADFLPMDIRAAFPTAHDIDFEWHIKHQAAWQKYITSAVSKTINMINEAKVADVDKAYRMAYTEGCKGITVYRDGTRNYQPLSTQKSEPNGVIQIGKRAPVTYGSNRKVPNGCGNLMVYIGGNKDNVHEITARLGKGGGCAAAQTEAIARMASIAMQHGAAPEKISNQLGGIRCHVTSMYRSEHTQNKPRIITSCGDAISVALSEHVAETNGTTAEHKATNGHVGACPSCGASMAFEEGCAKCYNCGFAKC